MHAKGEFTANERWALIRSAMEDQSSGAMHVDIGTRDYKYTRTEAPDGETGMRLCLAQTIQPRGKAGSLVAVILSRFPRSPAARRPG
jgi:hypothetical protein